MPQASYWVNRFVGGEWAGYAANRIDDPAYANAMSTSLNGFPRLDGTWTRRPGFRYMAHTRRGKNAKLRSFAFAATEAYIVELTDGIARFYSGGAPVMRNDDNVTIASISGANPAVVTVNGILPSTWADGDTVMFEFNGYPPTAPQLAGRQFEIINTTTSSFEIYDALSGQPVDGATVSYSAPIYGDPDRLLKIHERATPYLSGAWQNTRLVATPDTAYLLNPDYQPLAITFTGGELVIKQVSFSDGPYLDENTTSTTLTPSGTSGSVTITASATTGINGGAGFRATDVGRHIRLRAAPANWNSGTTYAAQVLVTASDSLIYRSVIGGNINHNPATDDGTYWQYAGVAITWTWAVITAVSSSTAVTATISGPALYSTAAIAAWRLGLYSDTTGWPACGAFHEGRLWLSGAAPNRIDASVSNALTTFSPTGQDGTVASANAISATLNATENNQIFWMLPDATGLMCGTQAGEWQIRSSAIGDPLAPDNIQARRVSTYGCANIEPVCAVNTNIFVQARQRKLIDHSPEPSGEWSGTTVSLLADHLTAGGIAELAYQQEPYYTLWMRRNDGVLVGATYNKSPSERESINAWHQHSIGGGRTVSSITTCPAPDGLSTTLAATLYDPASGYYHTGLMMPVFDDALAPYQATFMDGVAAVQCTQQLSTAGGDSFDGLRVHGLTYANGETVRAFIGGMDVGTFTVSSGRIDIPFTSTFTAAFLASVASPSGYGLYTILVTPKPANYTSSSMLLYTNAHNYSYFIVGGDEAFAFDLTNTAIAKYNLASGQLTTTYAKETIFGPGVFYAQGYVAGDSQGFLYAKPTFASGTYPWYHPSGHIFMSVAQQGVGLRNSDPIVKIDVATGKMVASFGTWSNNTVNSRVSGFVSMGSTACVRLKLGKGKTKNFLACTGSVLQNQFGILNTDDMVATHTDTLPSGASRLTAGFDGTNTVYGVVVGASAITVLKWVIDAFGGPVKTTIGSVVPSAVDATWTAFDNTSFDALLFDPTDGHIIMFITSPAGPTNRRYWIKIRTTDASLAWATVSTATASPIPDYDLTRTKLRTNEVKFWSAGSIWTLNTSTGGLTSASYATSIVLGTTQTYVPKYRGCILKLNYTYGSGTKPVYLNGASDTLTNNSVAMITLTGPSSSSSSIWPPAGSSRVPGAIGADYVSRGQLVRPDMQRDGGAATGPGVGKRRRNHRYTISLYRSRGVSVGTSFNALKPVPLIDAAGTVTLDPNLYTGIVTDSLVDDHSFDGMLAWECSGAYPVTIAGIGGRIETTDD